ncbi:hypothetical protein WAI453_005593 [Rhynchosporium graminicola]
MRVGYGWWWWWDKWRGEERGGEGRGDKVPKAVIALVPPTTTTTNQHTHTLLLLCHHNSTHPRWSSSRSRCRSALNATQPQRIKSSTTTTTSTTTIQLGGLKGQEDRTGQDSTGSGIWDLGSQRYGLAQASRVESSVGLLGWLGAGKQTSSSKATEDAGESRSGGEGGDRMGGDRMGWDGMGWDGM